MTDGVTITGGWQLTQRFVGVVIAGLDCGNFVVAADGTIFVPYGSDPDGLLTPSYLNAVSDPRSTNAALVSFSITVGSDTITVYVPVLIGYVYVSQGQTLRPKTEPVTKNPTGGVTGMKRRIYGWGASLTNTVGLQVGTTFSNTQPMPFYDLNQTNFTRDQMYTGIVFSAANDSDSYDGQLCFQVTRPYPCTINTLTAYMDIEPH